MNTPLRVSAAALICLGLATACVRTTEGTVAMTTEPGAPLTTTRTTTSTPSTTTTSPTRTTTPGSPTTSPTGAVPAPANSMTMMCDEFIELDQPTRLAVVQEILANEESSLGVLGDEFAESIANTMCQFMTTSSVRDVLAGSPPP